MNCRSCGTARCEVFLDLGSTPLANSYPLPAELAARPEPTYRLAVAFCHDCALVQLTETVPPELLFGEYLYFSSFSTTMLEHAQTLARDLIATRRLGPQSLVVEVASNDGYLLRNYAAAGIPVLGIEPARNIAEVANERGVPTRNVFFGAATAADLAREGLRADVLHAHNVLAHVADLNGFVGGIATVLKPLGMALFEVPYVQDLVDTVAFDTVYHEHLCYFSVTALDALFRRHGLVLRDVVQMPIHGGSLRLQVVQRASPEAVPSANVARLLAAEKAGGAADLATYRGFATRVDRLRLDLRTLLLDLKARGQRLAAYGAAAKGSTLLNTSGIGTELLEFVVDRSPHKQGRLMPGVHVPIDAPERLLREQPDYVLLLTWNFAAEILLQQAEYRARGGRFIVPVPSPHILD